MSLFDYRIIGLRRKHVADSLRNPPTPESPNWKFFDGNETRVKLLSSRKLLEKWN